MSKSRGKRNVQQKLNKNNDHQKGRQQGAQTGGEAFKSNSQEFFRHPGQGMRGNEGGQREAAERQPGSHTTGSDTRKHTRPENER